ncbi:MAG: hypothetical protein ACE5KE_03070 [Methanosarcinales archaeon]
MDTFENYLPKENQPPIPFVNQEITFNASLSLLLASNFASAEITIQGIKTMVTPIKDTVNPGENATYNTGLSNHNLYIYNIYIIIKVR